MSCKRWFPVFLFLLAGQAGISQKIIYSEPDRDDSRRMNFEIVGKVGGNFMIYKNTRNKYWMTVYDNDMKQVSKTEMDYIPDNDRLINIDFFPYSDHVYMIYQYQKKNIIHCMAAKLDATGKLSGDVQELDTTQLGFTSDNKIYTAITSDDKSRISVFKINSRNKRNFLMTTMLLNDKLELLKKNRYAIPMEERNDYLNEFYVDNDGDLVFCKFTRGNNDNINHGTLYIKKAMEDSLFTHDLDLTGIWLDEIKIKIDNFNKRYFLTAFYYKESRGNIDGLYFFAWDKVKGEAALQSTSSFPEDLRREARGESGVKMAFNDYFIRHIITRRDGGFIIGSEAYYTTSRFNNWNRWDYLYGSPYLSSYNSPYYSPYYSNYLWNNRINSSQAVRYHADHITVLSFSKTGEVEWRTVIAKSQYDDESDELVSYQLMNTGGSLHFLYNEQERRNNLLSDYSISPEGVMTRNPTLKNLDKGYDFMAKFGKQVSARQMIIPCYYLTNQVCFAKLEYN